MFINIAFLCNLCMWFVIFICVFVRFTIFYSYFVFVITVFFFEICDIVSVVLFLAKHYGIPYPRLVSVHIVSST